MEKNNFFSTKQGKLITVVVLVLLVLFLVPKISKRIEAQKELKALRQKAYEDLAPKGDGKVYTLEELRQKAYEDLAPKSE